MAFIASAQRRRCENSRAHFRGKGRVQPGVPAFAGQPGRVEVHHRRGTDAGGDLGQEFGEITGGAGGHGRYGAIGHRDAEQLPDGLRGAFLGQELTQARNSYTMTAHSTGPTCTGAVASSGAAAVVQVPQRQRRVTTWRSVTGGCCPGGPLPAGFRFDFPRNDRESRVERCEHAHRTSRTPVGGVCPVSWIRDPAAVAARCRRNPRSRGLPPADWAAGEWAVGEWKQPVPAPASRSA